jgi:thiol:disulfide interchange protein/DsbC/DsbD-like thiol-disulfide interchange protein
VTLEIAGFSSEGGPLTTFFVSTGRKGSSMNSRSRLLLTGLLLLVAVGVYSQSLQGSAGAHTSVALIADVKSVKPGLPFTVGIRMTMDPGWHTYWKNPGESGLATSVDWGLPSGLSAGEIGWPLPGKTVESGDVLTYGYAHENMLLVRMSPSPVLKPGSRLTVKAKVSWLECEKTCVPGEASVELTLPVLPDDPAADHILLFQKYRGLIPDPWDENAGFMISPNVGKGMVELRLTAKPGKAFVTSADGVPDFYPGPTDNLTTGRVQVKGGASEVVLNVPFSSSQPLSHDAVVRGVIVYRFEGGERRGVSYEVPVGLRFQKGFSGGGSSVPEKGLLDRTFETGQDAGSRQSFILYIFFALVGGLLLNVMPCVLPVIALKVFGLVRMAGDHPGQVKKLGWFFSLGILVSFLVLASVVIVLKVAGQQVGWGFQFQEPLFVIAMCAVVFAFGLSLFGVYDIRLPGAAVTGVSSATSRQGNKGGGYAASFWEGVFATILATPCTAPFLGSALGFAFAQPPLVNILVFGAVAIGMALPYLLLTAKPAWMKFLPKPGAWMETAKQFMGFLMMATLIWLLYILGKQLGMEAVIWTAAFLLTVGISCWLVGRFATLTASRRRASVTWVVAVALAVFGYWWFVENTLNVRGLIAGEPTSGESGAPQAGGIAWRSFSLAGLEADLKDSKAVFLDFTAEWCLTCKVNEKTVLSDPLVVEKFRTSGILPVRADWTNRNQDITRLLAKFGRSGVPLYVLFPAGHPNQPIVLPEVITSGMIVEAIDKAAGVR